MDGHMTSVECISNTSVAIPVGYGDLPQPFELRWFQIFYLTISTYFVGSALGQLGNLKSELADIRLSYAWESRPVTKRFMEEVRGYDGDDKCDQYEFVLSGLLMLGKINSSDVQPIMNKFRALAGQKGYISVEDDIICEQAADVVSSSKPPI